MVTFAIVLLKWSKMTKVLVSLGTFLDRTLFTHVVDRYQDIATQAVLVLVTNGPLKWSLLQFLD
jgi:hypothetical protein